MDKAELIDRIKERAAEMQECGHLHTHVENDRRFGLLVVCDGCDQVVDVKTN